MPGDKFSAVWVSHSSMGDFLKCPRAYFLNNIYKDPKTGHKIALMQPPLALGQAVHEVLESLSVLPVEKRFETSLIERYEQVWKKLSGVKGGFFDQQTENKYRNRGVEMLKRVKADPGPIARKAVKIKTDLPYYWLSEEDNIILCGKIDWLEYLPELDAVHIIDFKTGKKEEEKKSLQLPIYYLLVHNCQHRKVSKASYWYLERDSFLTEKELPDLDMAHQEVLKVAKKIKLARTFGRFECPQGENGCYACKPLEQILNGEAQLVGTNDYNQDVYVLAQQHRDTEKESEIL